MKKSIFIAIIAIIIITSLFSTAMAAEKKTPVGTIEYPTTGSGGIIATRFTQEGALAPRETIPEWARRSIEPYKGSWSQAPGRLDKASRAWPAGAEKGLSSFSIYGWSMDPQAAIGGLGWPDLNNNGAIDSLDELQALLWATVWSTEPYGLPGGLTVARTSDPSYGSVFLKFKNVTLELRKVRRTFHFNVIDGGVVTTPVNGWCWSWAWAQPGKGNGNNGGSNQPTVTKVPTNPTSTPAPTTTATTTATPAPTAPATPTATPAPTTPTVAPTATPDPKLDPVPSEDFEQQMFESATPIVAPRPEQNNTPATTPAPTPANTADHIVLDVVVDPVGWTSNFEATQVASAPSSEGARHRGTTEADTANTTATTGNDTGNGFSISASSEVAGANQPAPALDPIGADPWD